MTRHQEKFPRGWADNGAPKVQRANDCIKQLHEEISAFLERRPYSDRKEIEAQTGDVVMVARISEKPDVARLGAITADAVHNLRVALDFLWIDVLEVTVEPSRPKATDRKFPIFENEAQFENARARQKEKMRPVYEQLKYFEPYNGGKNALDSLRRLDNAGKHERLIPVAHFAKIQYDTAPYIPLVGFISTKVVYGFRDGEEIFRYKPGTRAGRRRRAVCARD